MYLYDQESFIKFKVLISKRGSGSTTFNTNMATKKKWNAIMNLKNPKRIYNYGTYNNANNAPLSLRCQICVCLTQLPSFRSKDHTRLLK